MLRACFCLYDLHAFLLAQLSEDCPISALICPYITILRYFGAIPHDTGISMLCVAGLRYLFPSEKTSLYFVGAVGRPHFYYIRRAFHYIILFTLPGRAGGCCFAKANQNNKQDVRKRTPCLFYSAADCLAGNKDTKRCRQTLFVKTRNLRGSILSAFFCVCSAADKPIKIYKSLFFIL